MECYLDNSATTRCLDSAAALMAGILCTDYGNPSSLHHKGVQAEEYVRHAREVIAKTLKVTPKEIFFTSGGTESDNLALRGAAYANARQGKHLITTSIEHPAILNTMQYLEQQGFEVTYLPVDENGKIRLSDLEAVCAETTTCRWYFHDGKRADQWTLRTGQRTACVERVVCGCAQRGASACAGGTGNLCVRRKRVRIEPPGYVRKRDASGDRSAEGAVKFDDPFQPFRLYDRRRN